MRHTNRGLLILIWMLCYLPCLEAQGFRVETTSDGRGDTGYSTKWDSAQDRLILYRDTSGSAVPAARVFGKDGASVPVYPLRDLTDSWYVDIWSAAATPEGGIVLSAVVGYAPRGGRPVPVKPFLLTYDGAGRLRKAWEVKPYHHHLVAVDREGNVFALGDRDDLAGPYPLLVKYSPDGQVLREFLSSGLFPEGDNVIASGSPNGESQLFARGDELFLWLARSQEFLRFSLAGDLLSRTSLGQALGRVATETGSGRTQVLSVATTHSGEIIAQVTLWPNLKGGAVKFGMLRVPADGSQATLMQPIASVLAPGRFLGTTAEGKLVFLEQQGKAGVITEY